MRSSFSNNKFNTSFSKNKSVQKLLTDAVKMHENALKTYDQWNYDGVLQAAAQILSNLDQALTIMGEPDRIHDPLTELMAAKTKKIQLQSLPPGQIQKTLRNITLDEYKARALMAGH